MRNGIDDDEKDAEVKMVMSDSLQNMVRVASGCEMPKICPKGSEDWGLSYSE